MACVHGYGITVFEILNCFIVAPAPERQGPDEPVSGVCPVWRVWVVRPVAIDDAGATRVWWLVAGAGPSTAKPQAPPPGGPSQLYYGFT
eukprot:496226-Prymnesium_polylepis.2